MKESLGLLAGRFRKHFSMETVSVYTVRNLYISSFMNLIEIEGYKKASERVFSWGYDMGHDYMLTLRKDLERVTPFKDFPFVAKLAWYIFSGKYPAGVKSWWEKWLEADVYLLKFWDDDSPWCRGIESPGKKICFYPAGAYEGAYQTAQLILGLDRVGVVRELACKASGDERCEWLIVDLPYESDRQLETLLEETSRRIPGFFDDISSTFSLKLRKGIF